MKTEYAHALYLALKDKNEEQRNRVISNFHAVLRRKGHISLVKGISKEFSKLAGRSQDSSVTIVVNRMSDTNAIHDARDVRARFFREREETIISDETITGGFIIESKTKLFDASYKNMLLKMYRQIISK